MASFNKVDRTWLPTIVKFGEFSKLELALLESAFDDQTNYDIEQIHKETKVRKECRKRIILYPLQTIIFKLLLTPPSVMEDRKKVNNIYKAFYKKRIDYQEFQKRLSNFLKDSKLLK